MQLKLYLNRIYEKQLQNNKILDLSFDDFQNFASDAKLAAFFYTARNIFLGRKEWKLFLKDLFEYIDRFSDEKNVDFLELILVYIVKTRQDNPRDLIKKLSERKMEGSVMTIAEQLTKDAVKKGIAEGIEKAVGIAVEKAVEEAVEKASDKVAYETRCHTAKAMIAKGMDFLMIADLTELTIEDIERLASKRK